MKMKNKVLGILVTLIIMIGIMASQVNAADISASAAEVNVGDEITVTVTLKEATQAIDLELTYNASNFEYVKKSVTSGLDSLTTNDTVPGTVKISGADPYNSTTYVEYTFKAIAKTEADPGDFVASGLYTESEEALDVNTVSVTVTEKADEPTNPEEPGEDVNTPDTNVPGETTDDGQTGSETNSNSPKVDEDGNVITKLPQTGVTVFQIAGIAAVVIIAGVLAVRKLRK